MRKEDFERDVWIQTFTLNIGDWRKLFTEYEYKMLICRALNESVVNNEFEVLGYMITNLNAFLILETPINEDGHAILNLERRLRYEIQTNLNFLNKLWSRELNGNFKKFEQPVFGKLFQVKPLINKKLVALLRGRLKLEKYYDPVLDKMQDLSINNPFSSAKPDSFKNKEWNIGPVLLKQHLM